MSNQSGNKILGGQMLRREGNEELSREVNKWLERNEIPLERYGKLSPGSKEALRNQLSIPTHPASDRQLKDLYIALCLPEIAGKESINPVDFMPHEKLREFFTPPPPSETLSYYEKF